MAARTGDLEPQRAVRRVVRGSQIVRRRPEVRQDLLRQPETLIGGQVVGPEEAVGDAHLAAGAAHDLDGLAGTAYRFEDHLVRTCGRGGEPNPDRRQVEGAPDLLHGQAGSREASVHAVAGFVTLPWPPITASASIATTCPGPGSG